MFKVNEFYKHKDSGVIIQIESFATPLRLSSETLIIFRFIDDLNNYAQCFSGPKYYATSKELMEYYELIEDAISLS